MILTIFTDISSYLDIFDTVIIEDGTWCFQYDKESKRQSTLWKTNFHKGKKTANTTIVDQNHTYLFLQSVEHCPL